DRTHVDEHVCKGPSKDQGGYARKETKVSPHEFYLALSATAFQPAGFVHGSGIWNSNRLASPFDCWDRYCNRLDRHPFAYAIHAYNKGSCPWRWSVLPVE